MLVSMGAGAGSEQAALCLALQKVVLHTSEELSLRLCSKNALLA